MSQQKSRNSSPTECVLGPLLFVIFINYLDYYTGMVSMMKKFADDTKLENRASNANDCEMLQQCIDKLITWADTWHMEFNIKKCKVMHNGRGNLLHQYTMSGTPLQTCEGEHDIGVYTSNTLNPAHSVQKQHGE